MDFTDGASANHADPLWRLAAVGAFLAPALELNVTLLLPEQTNQRVELYGFTDTWRRCAPAAGASPD